MKAWFQRMFRRFETPKSNKVKFPRRYPEIEPLEIRWMPSITSAYQRVTDPEQGQRMDFGRATVLPNTGGLVLSTPLDFDVSPGTSVGRNPALVFNSETLNVRPVVEVILTTNAGSGLPTEIDGTFTFNGSTQTTVVFSTSGHSAGDTYVLAFQAATAVTSTGAYAWDVSIDTVYSGGTVTDTTSGTAYAVVNGPTQGIGYGWSWDHIHTIVPVSGGVMFVYGGGGYRLFTGSSGTYTNPDNDFGTMVKNGNGTYTYTEKDQTVYNFDSSGRMTSVVDTDSQAVTYSYSSSRLTGVQTPDGGLTTITYRTVQS